MEIKLTYANSGNEEVLQDMKKIYINVETEEIVISHSNNKEINEYISFKTLSGIEIK